VKKIVIIFFISIAVMAFSNQSLSPKNVDDGVIFYYQDNNAESVSVAGDFNGWDKNHDSMTKGKDGIFSIKLPLKEGEYAYKFVINGKKWIKDPNALKFDDDGFGGQNSIVVVKRPVKKIVIQPKPEVTIKDMPGNVLFKYKNTKAKTVSVVGKFNKWKANIDFLSDKDGDGTWTLKKFLPPGKYVYFFVIDDKRWVADPNAKVKIDDGFGGKNSEVVVNE
jgi:1,4-alpha-glucan branching enzyme